MHPRIRKQVKLDPELAEYLPENITVVADSTNTVGPLKSILKKVIGGVADERKVSFDSELEMRLLSSEKDSKRCSCLCLRSK